MGRLHRKLSLRSVTVVLILWIALVALPSSLTRPAAAAPRRESAATPADSARAPLPKRSGGDPPPRPPAVPDFAAATPYPSVNLLLTRIVGYLWLLLVKALRLLLAML
jgi:hypothetical protein